MLHRRNFTIPEVILFVGTRVALGAGLGLIIGDRIGSDARKGAGWALIAVGALSTIPFAVAACRGQNREQLPQQEAA